jgi:hypothetical protein
VTVGPEPFDSPDAVALRAEHEAEIAWRYGGPGSEPV